MKRRNFIQNTSILASAAFLPIETLTYKNMKTYKLGYQLFSIRDEMAKDPIATVKALKGMGYEDFEVNGYNFDDGSIYGMAAKEFHSVLNDLGVSVSSGHYLFSAYLDASIDEMKRVVDSAIRGAKALKSEYITWPVMSVEQRTAKNFRKLPEILNRIGEQVRDAGLEFAYHNHGFEFEQYDDFVAIDKIVNETDPALVKLQMDMYWVMHAGTTTPKDLVDKNPGRFVMWHVKDMDAQTRDYTELGNGAINYQNVLPDAEKSGLEYLYIEQGGNYKTSSLQSAKDSALYYTKHLANLI